MAAKDLDRADITQQELEDITTCCICTEIYTDPKALPCIHTFCIKCLRETGLKTNKEPGDEMPCPICRRLFKIPPEGFHGLPKNVFIERLIQVSKFSDPSAVSSVLCSVCLEENKEQEGKETPTADAYCVECKHKLCEECRSEHRKFKLTKNHKSMPINEYENVMADQAPSACELHEQRILNVYCIDCDIVACTVCCIEAHKNHKYSYVNKCLDSFRKQIQNNTEAMNKCISHAQMKKANILKAKEEMQNWMERLECDVVKRKDEIKQFADEDAHCLMQGLCSERQSRLKEIQMATDDIDAYLSNLESYNSYCRSIMDKGSVSDNCSALSDLYVRAFELQQQCQPIIERRIQDFKFRFRQSELEEFLEEYGGNLMGEIEEEGDLKPKKRSKIVFAELSNEIDILRKELKLERTVKENLQSAIDQLRAILDNEAQVNKSVREELIKEKVNYKAHVEELKQELANIKITNNELQANNDKLMQELCEEKTTNNSLQGNNEKYVQELDMYKEIVKTLLESNAKKLGKELETTKAVKLRYKSDPILVKTIRTKAAEEKQKWIRGLTIFDQELFVVSNESSEVEVYDSMKFSLSRRYNVKKLINPRDIESCNRIKCLYIFDFKGYGQSSEILRVDPNGKLINNWSTGDDNGWGLSVTDESTVILSVQWKNKLNEYSPDGELIREINLSPDADIHHPLHAVKLTNGHFVVSHGDSEDDLHRVCITDTDGKLKKSFGGKPGSTIGQMDDPIKLAVDGIGSVMVVDRCNHRVLLLGSDLEFKREILSREKHGLRYPQRILLDESHGRLFVADNNDGGRILIFNF